MGAVKFLLDTCTFFWLALEPERLSPSAIRILDDPTSRLFPSDVSVWEIVLKHTAGKPSLPDLLSEWLPQQISHWQLENLPIGQSAIYRSGMLPKVHPDPFERLMAVSAMESGLTLLSPDVSLSSLGAARLW